MNLKTAAAASLALLLLTGCGSAKKDAPKEEAPKQAEKETEKEIKKEEDKEQKREAPKKEETKPEKPKFEEQVIFDQDGLKVIAKGLADSFSGTDLKLYIENGTETKYMVQARDVSINGRMMDPMMSADVAPGKKVNDGMSFMRSQLKDNNIKEIATIEFRLCFINADDWTDSFESEPVTLQFADPSEDAGSVEGEVLVDQDGLKITYTGVSDDSIFGPGLSVFLENNTDGPLTVQVRDLSINGYMVDGVFSCEIMPGKKASDSITMMKSDLEANDIGTIESVELSFQIYHESFADSYQIGPISFNAK